VLEELQGRQDLPGLAKYWLDFLSKTGLSGMGNSPNVVLKQDSPAGLRDIDKVGEARAAQLENNQTFWLHLPPGYRDLEIFDESLGSDKAIIAALTTLETATQDKERLRQAILIYLVSKNALQEAWSTMKPSLTSEFIGHLLKRSAEALEEAQAKYPLLHDANPDDLLTALGGANTFRYVERLLRYFRPNFGNLIFEEQAALIEGTCIRVNKFRRATEDLMAFIEYGGYDKDDKDLRVKKLKPGLEDARRDIRAVVLRDVEGMSVEAIGKELGANPPGESNKIKKYHSTVGTRIKRGRALVEGAWGKEGWQERADAMRHARQNYLVLSEKDRAILEMAERLALHAGVPVERAQDLIQQDSPDENLDAFSSLLWAADRSMLETWFKQD
jgi:hypothetical protein